MAHFDGAEFAGGRIELDGNSYTNCRFNGCTMVYSGGEIPVFNGTNFHDTHWSFEGPAGRTFDLMRILYTSPGGEKLADAIFPFIVRPAG